MNYYKYYKIVLMFLVLIPLGAKAQIEVCKYPGCGKFIAKSKNEKGDRFCPYWGNHPVPMKVSKPVDLGLPSGTMWAEWNIGASSPEQTGNYYAWGEIEPKTSYYWNYFDVRNKNAKEDEGLTFIKYTKTGNNSIVGTAHDVAHVKWGSNWLMPTFDQYKELLFYCEVKEEVRKGKKGLRIIGPNKNSIFIPAGGFKYKTSLNNPENFEYWMGELCKSEFYGDEYAAALTDAPIKNGNFFDSFSPRLRRHGALVRAVWVDKDKPESCILQVSGDTFSMFEGYVDGQSKGLVPFRANSLSKGEHFLVVKKPGYRVFGNMFTIDEGNIKDIVVNLPLLKEELNNAGMMLKYGDSFYSDGFVKSGWNEELIEPVDIQMLEEYLEKIATNNKPESIYGFHIKKESISALYPERLDAIIGNGQILKLDLQSETLLSLIESEKKNGYNDPSINDIYMDREDSLSVYVSIDKNGEADFPIIGRCHVAGLNMDQCNQFLREHYARFFQKKETVKIDITLYKEYYLSSLKSSSFNNKDFPGGRFILKCKKSIIGKK